MASSKADPLITIGILTRDRAWSLPRVLAALEAFDYDKKSLRLVFVDGLSTDGTQGIIDGFLSENGGGYGSVEVVESATGIPGARNECIRRAAGSDYIFFLDSDVVAGPGVLKRLLSHLKGGTAGIASLPYDSENSRGKLGPLVNAFNTPGGPAEAWKVAAGCTLISMKVVESVGGFNEGLRVLEDGEYCYRARKAGYRIVCDFGYPASHLKSIKMGASSYLGFVRDSADFYLAMARLGSGIYRARYLLSAALLVAVGLLLAGQVPAGAVLLVVALVFSLWVNSSDRLWGDGSTIKPAYRPVMGLVITLATVAISLYSAARVLGRGVGSTQIRPAHSG